MASPIQFMSNALPTRHIIRLVPAPFAQLLAPVSRVTQAPSLSNPLLQLSSSCCLFLYTQAKRGPIPFNPYGAGRSNCYKPAWLRLSASCARAASAS